MPAGRRQRRARVGRWRRWGHARGGGGGAVDAACACRAHTRMRVWIGPVVVVAPERQVVVLLVRRLDRVLLALRLLGVRVDGAGRDRGLAVRCDRHAHVSASWTAASVCGGGRALRDRRPAHLSESRAALPPVLHRLTILRQVLKFAHLPCCFLSHLGHRFLPGACAETRAGFHVCVSRRFLQKRLCADFLDHLLCAAAGKGGSEWVLGGSGFGGLRLAATPWLDDAYLRPLSYCPPEGYDPLAAKEEMAVGGEQTTVARPPARCWTRAS